MYSMEILPKEVLVSFSMSFTSRYQFHDWPSDDRPAFIMCYSLLLNPGLRFVGVLLIHPVNGTFWYILIFQSYWISFPKTFKYPINVQEKSLYCFQYWIFHIVVQQEKFSANCFKTLFCPRNSIKKNLFHNCKSGLQIHWKNNNVLIWIGRTRWFRRW